MTNFIISLCVLLLANLWWIYKANKAYDEWAKRYSVFSNPFRSCAEQNLNNAIGVFLLLAVLLIVMLLAVGGALE